MNRREAGEAFAGDLEDLTAPERAVRSVAEIIEAELFLFRIRFEFQTVQGCAMLYAS